MRKKHTLRCWQCKLKYQHRNQNHKFCSWLCYARWAKKRGWWGTSKVTPEQAAARVDAVNREMKLAAQRWQRGG